MGTQVVYDEDRADADEPPNVQAGIEEEFPINRGGKFRGVFAQLAAPFHKNELKQRKQSDGKMLTYITGRSVMNRLDEVLGPENWFDDYEVWGGGCKCRLTILLPDGRSITKTGIGGFTQMRDSSDTDKTGEVDALKRAAVKIGIGRYLYQDGVPDFVDEANAERHQASRQAEQQRPQQQANGRANANRNGNANRNDDGQQERQDPPGLRLMAWLEDWARETRKGGKDIAKYALEWARRMKYPDRPARWSVAQADAVYNAAVKQLRATGYQID